ncbi:MAG: hypothetical protein WDZ51_03860 [Pirellulaceae bacterium]
MIPNKYNPETIHVANWYLLTQADRLPEIFAKSHKTVIACGESSEHDEDLPTIADCLKQYIEGDIFLVAGKGIGQGEGIGTYDLRGEGGDDPGSYADPISINTEIGPLTREFGPEYALIAPLLSESLSRVDFQGVADLLLELAPAVRIPQPKSD